MGESKHEDLAYSFIDYLLRPEVAAKIAVEMRTATANGAARAAAQCHIVFAGPNCVRHNDFSSLRFFAENYLALGVAACGTGRQYGLYPTPEVTAAR